MKRNIGRAERVIRILIGAGIICLALFGPRNPWAWLGLVPLLTGALGWCPGYRLLKITSHEETQ
jgi:hypothetical protein